MAGLNELAIAEGLNSGRPTAAKFSEKNASEIFHDEATFPRLQAPYATQRQQVSPEA